ncbi:hypothetical protein [Deinococcus maricopensis]|uniref:Uncharacterized protein n=1 Tax=Deinococcus maricopensis (strain DSM 21211 / LMG 22137 / NRRL B-23946 / LB-34) TaxID=709986 RepID=E8UA05_DEIML|nr:hypothetical protein [Deinococcus maricopensis]ADV67894.1 hypothetical protein Deima_2256 [Deinococcus maricopensis DSM 21211]
MNESNKHTDQAHAQQDLVAETPRGTYDAPQDPKDDAQRHYTTTPAKDENGARDETGPGEPMPQDPDPQETLARSFKGTDHPAVTRDPYAAERHLQDPDYAGSETVSGISTDTLDALQPGVNLGFNPVAVTQASPVLGAVDQNPAYVPPSERGPAHVGEQREDLPADLPNAARVDDQTRRGGDR